VRDARQRKAVVEPPHLHAHAPLAHGGINPGGERR
jgi:hypothetical protein